MTDLELKDLPNSSIESVSLVGFDSSGNAKKIENTELNLKKGDRVTLFKDRQRHYNTTITLSQPKSNFRFLVFYHGAYAVGQIMSLEAIRHILGGAFDSHGNTDRTFMLPSYFNHYTDVLIDDVDDNKVRIDNTGDYRGVFMIEGII